VNTRHPGVSLSTADAHRHVRRELARHARAMVTDPGVVGDPTSRARLVAAWQWVADWLAPTELSVLPANLRPLVTPHGTRPDGAPEDWSRFHGQQGQPDGPGAA